MKPNTKRRQKSSSEATQASEELTMEETARILHVSRTYLQSLVDDGRLPVVRTAEDGRRWISRAVVLAYRERMRAAQKEGLDAMMDASERLGLYDAELEGLPARRNK